MYFKDFFIINFNFFFFKTQLTESKKSGGPPITIQYKEEIEAILNKDRPTLNPKSCIDSSALLSEKEDSSDIQENFIEDKNTETPYILPKISRKHKNKQEPEGLDLLDVQSKKKSKKNGSNLENIIQKWVEQQEIRQIEFDRRREEKEKKEQEQKTELLRMKHQSDMMLFGLLGNLTNSLNSLNNKNDQLEKSFDQTNQGKLLNYFNIMMPV